MLFIKLSNTDIVDPMFFNDLEERGAKIKKYMGNFNVSDLAGENFADYNEVWLLSSPGTDPLFSRDEYRIKGSGILEKIKDSVTAGAGLALFADNDPNLIEANELAKIMGLVDTDKDLFSGCSDDSGNELNKVKDAPVTNGFAISFPIFSGLVSLNLGISLSKVNTQILKDTYDLLAVSPKGFESLVSIRSSRFPKSNIILDGGSTKMFGPQYSSGGTPRYLRNLACYLSRNR
jgi:hypothetical protein